MALEATPKRARESGGSSTAASEPDRLSTLPDCLLHVIMSFMKARQVVQTCVLATRWKHLWRSVPCLNVDMDEFKRVEQGWDYDSDDADKEWEDFEDFTVNLMLRRNIALLDSFRLRVSGGAAYMYITDKIAGGWLRRAMKYCAPDPGIQREGLSSNSWRLRRLHLYNVFLDSYFAKHVSSACHSLEDLELKNCTCKHHAITSDSLKNLVLKNCIFSELSDITSTTLKSLVIDRCQFRCLLVITTPAVAFLLLTGNPSYFHAGISINEMPSLDKASICLCYYRWFELLCSASNVTRLELSDLATMGRSEEPPAFKEFSNLRNLFLDNCDLSDGFQTLAFFLQNSPRLEKLTLRHCMFPDDSEKMKETPKPKERSSQFCNLNVQCVNLKLTEIIYEDDDDVRQLVELLLPISGILQKNHLKLTKDA